MRMREDLIIMGYTEGISLIIVVTVLYLFTIGFCIYMKKTCWYPVKATILENMRYTSSGKNSNIFIIEYFYKNQRYQCMTPVNVDGIKAGDTVDFLINPEKPKKIYHKSLIKYLLVMMGSLYILGIVAGLYQMKKG